MTDDQVKEQGTQDAAKDAVEEALDIQASIREITLKALSERKLDRQGIKAVIQAVTQGVLSGIDLKPDQATENFNKALQGMDEALAKSAQAAKLASEEAAAKISDFTQHDFKDTLDQLETLEELFFDTIETVAGQASDLLGGTARDLSSHLKNTGSSVGRESQMALQALRDQFASISKESLSTAVEAGKEVSNQITEIASGILAGMSDAVSHKRSPES